jgi:hypothetical protein
VLFFGYGAMALFFVYNSRTVIDEGVYLNAGRLVWEGSLPYRDFPFSQAPLIAYVYGAFTSAFGSSVIVGRALSFVLGLAGVGAAIWIARAHAGRIGTAIVLLLSIANLPALWVAVTVRTQSLAAPLGMFSVLALALPRRGAWSWALSPSLMLWATGARLTHALAFAALAGWVAVRLRRQPRLLAYVAGILTAQAVVVFAPVLAAPRAALFHILMAQSTRGERAAGTLVPFGHWAHERFSIFLVPETSFFPIVALALVIAVHLGWKWSRGWRPDLERPLGDPLSAQLTLGLLAALVFVPHVLLSRGFLTYFVASSALLVPAIAIGVVGIVQRAGKFRPLAAAVVACPLVGGLLAVPVHWNAWIGSGESSFDQFRSVGRELRELAGRDCTILTLETALALETGCRVVPGLEYSLFSYFGRLDDDEARARGVLNASLLQEAVEELRPELIALGPRSQIAFSVGLGKRKLPAVARDGKPASLGFLDPGGYTFVGTYRVSSGAYLRRTPDHVEVSVFARDDLVSPRRRKGQREGAATEPVPP